MLVDWVVGLVFRLRYLTKMGWVDGLGQCRTKLSEQLQFGFVAQVRWDLFGGLGKAGSIVTEVVLIPSSLPPIDLKMGAFVIRMLVALPWLRLLPPILGSLTNLIIASPIPVRIMASFANLFCDLSKTRCS